MRSLPQGTSGHCPSIPSYRPTPMLRPGISLTSSRGPTSRFNRVDAILDRAAKLDDGRFPAPPILCRKSPSRVAFPVEPTAREQPHSRRLLARPFSQVEGRGVHANESAAWLRYARNRRRRCGHARARAVDDESLRARRVRSISVRAAELPARRQHRQINAPTTRPIFSNSAHAADLHRTTSTAARRSQPACRRSAPPLN